MELEGYARWEFSNESEELACQQDEVSFGDSNCRIEHPVKWTGRLQLKSMTLRY